jgi:hypothetical protein
MRVCMQTHSDGYLNSHVAGASVFLCTHVYMHARLLTNTHTWPSIQRQYDISSRAAQVSRHSRVCVCVCKNVWVHHLEQHKWLSLSHVCVSACAYVYVRVSIYIPHMQSSRSRPNAYAAYELEQHLCVLVCARTYVCMYVCMYTHASKEHVAGRFKPRL